jgi:hypothetical protein
MPRTATFPAAAIGGKRSFAPGGCGRIGVELRDSDEGSGGGSGGTESGADGLLAARRAPDQQDRLRDDTSGALGGTLIRLRHSAARSTIAPWSACS